MSPFHLSTEEVEQFEKNGYLGPYPLLAAGETKAALKACHADFPNLLLPNVLARHAVVKDMAMLAIRPAIMSRIVSLLGKNVLLWGSQLIEQRGRKIHRFHRDAEYAAIEGVCVWAGLKNVVRGETFSVITGSHLFNVSPQELKKRDGLNITDEHAVEKAAKEISPGSRLERLNISDGEFIIFSGKLWHATKNVTEESRYALNFRYTTPSNKVKISKNGELPHTSWEKHTPLCIVAAGEDHTGLNRQLAVEQISRTTALVKGVAWHLPNNGRKILFNTIQKLAEKYKKVA